MFTRHFNFGTLFTAAAISLITVACTDKATGDKQGEVFVIDKEELAEVDSWELDDIYESITITPLETTDASLFNAVEQTITCDSTILVRATCTAESHDAKILQFGLDGRFIRQIGMIGQGPGEYHSIDAMLARNDTLFAFDKGNRCVHLYSIGTGDHIASSKIDGYEPFMGLNTVISVPCSSEFMFTSAVIFDNQNYGTYSLAEGNPMDGSFDIIIPQHFKINTWIAYYDSDPDLCPYNAESALTIQPLNDTIYSVDYSTHAVKPFAITKFGKPMPQFPRGEDYEVARTQTMAEGIYNLAAIFTSEDYLILNRMVIGSAIWNMREGRGWFTLNGWAEKMADAFPFFPTSIVETRPDNTFVCSYNATEVIEYYRATPDNAPYKPSGSALAGLNEDSNKVLVTYRLK